MPRSHHLEALAEARRSHHLENLAGAHHTHHLVDLEEVRLVVLPGEFRNVPSVDALVATLDHSQLREEGQMVTGQLEVDGLPNSLQVEPIAEVVLPYP